MEIHYGTIIFLIAWYSVVVPILLIRTLLENVETALGYLNFVTFQARGDKYESSATFASDPRIVVV